MHILVTGHRGYIGSALVERLKKYNSIVGYDLKDGHDINTIPLKEKFNLIIHLAGLSGVRESIKDPAAYWYHNVEASKRLFSVHGPDTRILYASSSSAAEPDLNPYAASKFCIEMAGGRYRGSLGMRFHTVYSDTPRKGMFVDKILNNKLEYVTNHSRDFIHMEDLLDAIELLTASQYGGTIDVGTGTSVQIASLAPADTPLRVNTEGERIQTCAHTKKLEEIGFKPKYDIVKFLNDRT
jgi:UDP-glucose 4-epimerase